MKVLNRLLDKIGVDKFLHFAFGGWIMSKFMESGNSTIMIIGILFVGFISIMKEYIFDKDSGADWKDIVAAMVGCLVEIASYFLIINL